MSDTSIANLIKHLGVTASTVTISNPNTAKAIYDLPQLSAEQVADAVKAARLVQPVWASTPSGDRAKWLFRLHDLILEEQDKLMDIVQLAKKQYPRTYIQTILLWTTQNQTGITAKQLEYALHQIGLNQKTVQRQVKNYNRLINEISFMNNRFHHMCIDLQIQKRNELIEQFILPYKTA